MQALLGHYNTGGWSCINAFIGFNSTRVSSCMLDKNLLQIWPPSLSELPVRYSISTLSWLYVTTCLQCV